MDDPANLIKIINKLLKIVIKYKKNNREYTRKVKKLVENNKFLEKNIDELRIFNGDMSKEYDKLKNKITEINNDVSQVKYGKCIRYLKNEIVSDIEYFQNKVNDILEMITSMQNPNTPLQLCTKKRLESQTVYLTGEYYFNNIILNNKPEFICDRILI